MTELGKILEELHSTQKLAEADLENTDPRTRPGREMLKNQAVEKLNTVKAQAAEAVKKAAFTLCVNGPGAMNFALIAEDKGAVVVDSSTLYKTLAQRCWLTIGPRKMFGFTQFSVLQSELRQWAKADKVEFKLETTGLDVPVDTFEDVVREVKKAIEASNGLSILKHDIETRALNLVLTEEVESKVVPVILLNTNENDQSSLIGTLFRGKGLTINTDQEVTETTVTKTFEQIKKTLKG
jgi:hypothetical protein